MDRRGRNKLRAHPYLLQLVNLRPSIFRHLVKWNAGAQVSPRPARATRDAAHRHPRRDTVARERILSLPVATLRCEHRSKLFRRPIARVAWTLGLGRSVYRFSLAQADLRSRRKQPRVCHATAPYWGTTRFHF